MLAITGLALPAMAATKSSHRTRKTRKVTTEAERQKQEDARLTRECRGRPNAGACLGYARPAETTR